jgi:hypothetical protein
MIATLLVNPEGTNLTAVRPEENDLFFGLMSWGLKDGTLKNILEKFQTEQPETFVQIFGDGDAAKAQRLIAYTAQRGKDADPEFNLTDESWISRFQKAAQNPALQAVQLKAFNDINLKYLNELSAIAPNVKTERGIAFLLDIAYQMGVNSAKKAIEEAQHEPVAQNESEFLRRLKDITMKRVQRFGQPIVRAIERRRQLFLTTPILSDQELGF